MKKIILILSLVCSVPSFATTMNQSLLNRFYAKMQLSHEGVSRLVLTDALAKFLVTLSGNDLAAAKKMGETLLSYQPMLDQNGAIQNSKNLGYSYFQNSFVLFTQEQVAQLHVKYGNAGLLTKDDFKKMYVARDSLLFSINVVDPTIPNLSDKVFVDVNLFTPVSKGDGQVTDQQIVYYSMMLNSARMMARQLMVDVIPYCDQGLGKDIMGMTMIKPACFRDRFFAHLDQWLINFPSFQAYWSGLSNDSKHGLSVWLEHASRRYGYTDESSPFLIGSFDYLSVPMMLQKIETMMSRFDLNDDSRLSKSEIFGMYPVFKDWLMHLSNTNQDYVLKGAFTYIFRFKELPNTTTAAGTAKFASWEAIYETPAARLGSDRGGLLNLMCLMAVPEQSIGSQRETYGMNAKICGLR